MQELPAGCWKSRYRERGGGRSGRGRKAPRGRGPPSRQTDFGQWFRIPGDPNPKRREQRLWLCLVSFWSFKVKVRKWKLDLGLDSLGDSSTRSWHQIATQSTISYSVCVSGIARIFAKFAEKKCWLTCEILNQRVFIWNLKDVSLAQRCCCRRLLSLWCERRKKLVVMLFWQNTVS